MIGDVVIPKSHHTRAAKDVLARLENHLRGRRTTITIAGESGAGKSEIAVELKRFLEESGMRVFIFQQDDYFHRPPKSNEQARRDDIGCVGLHEVDLELLDGHLLEFKDSPDKPINKPLVIFEEDRITEESVVSADFDIAIAEGTYVTSLSHADHRVFIDRTRVDTLNHRQDRAREAQDEFIEEVLKIEHDIISKHKDLADIIVNKDYSVRGA